MTATGETDRARTKAKPRSERLPIENIAPFSNESCKGD
jgi:hypothetical protein